MLHVVKLHRRAIDVLTAVQAEILEPSETLVTAGSGQQSSWWHKLLDPTLIEVVGVPYGGLGSTGRCLQLRNKTLCFMKNLCFILKVTNLVTNTRISYIH